MSKTISAVIITIFFLSSATAIDSQDAEKIPEVLLDVLKKFSFNDSSSVEDNNVNPSRKSANKDIGETIWAKIVELAPLLDDKTRGNEQHDKEQIENSIESPVTSKLNPAKTKFIKMRNVIEKLLSVEPITNETKKVVTEALEQIENELNVNQCPLKKIDVEAMRRRHSRNGEPNIVIPKNMAHTDIIMKHIRDKWDKVANKYSISDVDKNRNDTARKVAFLFLTRLRQFVFDIHDDYTKLQDRYDMECYYEGNNNKSVEFPVFRPPSAEKETYIRDEKVYDCDSIVICSAELLDFLTDFYQQLNETYSDVFKNYLEMYLKEVDANYEEKESFTNIISHIQHQVQKKIKKMFTKQIGTMNEVFSENVSKLTALKHVIDKTIYNAKEIIYASLSVNLRKMKPKLRLTVKQDIDIAAGIELGNLQKEFKDSICSVFKVCNGDTTWRKYNYQNIDNNIDPNSLKIRLKLGLAEDPLQALRNKLLGKFTEDKTKKSNGVETKEYQMKDIERLNARKLNLENFRRNFKTINVTRTTYASYVEKGTTKLVDRSMRENTTSTVKTNITIQRSWNLQ